MDREKYCPITEVLFLFKKFVGFAKRMLVKCSANLPIRKEEMLKSDHIILLKISYFFVQENPEGEKDGNGKKVNIFTLGTTNHLIE